MLEKICSFWGEKGIYHAGTISNWKQAMASAVHLTQQPPQARAGQQAPSMPASSSAATQQHAADASQPHQHSPYAPQLQQPQQQSQPHLTSPHAHMPTGSQPMHSHQALPYTGHPQQQQPQPGSEWRPPHASGAPSADALHSSNPPWGHSAPSMPVTPPPSSYLTRSSALSASRACRHRLLDQQYVLQDADSGCIICISRMMVLCTAVCWCRPP